MWIVYQLFSILLIIVTALIGDNLLEHSRNQLVKAIVDNSSHALIGLLSWMIVALNQKASLRSQILDIILCAIIASLIDLDHFCEAKSLHLKDAISLSQRPFLHSSTLASIIIIGILFFAYVINSVILERLGLIVFVAFGTHHTRDAYRRGYWFQPYGSTPPLYYYLYLIITILIPYLTVFWLKCFKFAKSALDNEKPSLMTV